MDHQHGLVTGFAIDKGIDLYFDVRGQMEDGRCDPHGERGDGYLFHE